MSRRSQLFTAAALLLFAGGVWLLTKPAPAAPVVPKKLTPPTVVKTVPAAAAAESGFPEFGTNAFAQAAKERGAAWLAKRGRDAGSLVAMYDVTGDEALLKEAAEKYPDNPVVCVAMLQQLLKSEAPAEEVRKWAEQFIKATPGNPMGHYFLATACSKAGDETGVKAALEKALEQPGRPDSLLRDRVMTVKEGALASGLSLGDASYAALAGPLERGGVNVTLGNNLLGFFKRSFAAAENAEDPARAQSLAELGVRVAAQLGYTKSPSLMDEMIAASLRKRVLTEMDPATEIGDSGRTAEEVRKDEPGFQDLLSKTTDMHTWLSSAPEAVRAAYTDRFVLDGEAAAMREFLAWKDRQTDGGK